MHVLRTKYKSYRIWRKAIFDINSIVLGLMRNNFLHLLLIDSILHPNSVRGSLIERLNGELQLLTL